MKRLLWLGLAVTVLLAAATALTLPPRAIAHVADFQPPVRWPVVRGAYHVHSQLSDGTGTLDEIAAAAARAGLQFVIVTDHGDGTREPAAPSYRAGVLCIDGVEISTSQGHYVALGLPRAPYRLAGDAGEVIDDVRRLGGFGIAAHPGSPKPELAWGAWDHGFDGLEWINADSEWRDEFFVSLGPALLAYFFRPVETLTSLLDRPADVLAHWDRLAAQRPVVGLAAADAHARLGFGSAPDPYDDRVVARLPSYEMSFRAFSNHLVLDAALTGDAAADARLILDALRGGRVFTSIEGAAPLGGFEATAISGGSVARVGERLQPSAPVVIEARVAAPPGTMLVVLKDGVPIYDATAASIRLDVGTARGAYRIEGRLPASAAMSSVPWLLTNPIYVGIPSGPQEGEPPAGAATDRLGLATALWRAEASEGSTSALEPSTLADGTPALRWTFSLAGGARGSQYAALRFPVDATLARYDRVQLRAVSDAPRRIWIQLRARGSGPAGRWGRTVYLDQTLRPIDQHFDALRPLERGDSGTLPLDRVDSLLLVVDTLNTLPGTSGTVWIPDLWLAR